MVKRMKLDRNLFRFQKMWQSRNLGFEREIYSIIHRTDWDECGLVPKVVLLHRLGCDAGFSARLRQVHDGLVCSLCAYRLSCELVQLFFCAMFVFHVIHVSRYAVCFLYSSYCFKFPLYSIHVPVDPNVQFGSHINVPISVGPRLARHYR
jgi:hypothetical protein